MLIAINSLLMRSTSIAHIHLWGEGFSHKYQAGSGEAAAGGASVAMRGLTKVRRTAAGVGVALPPACCHSGRAHVLTHRTRACGDAGAFLPRRASSRLASAERSNSRVRASTSDERPSRADLYANESMDSLEISIDPDDRVEDIMTPYSAVATISPDRTLQEARTVLQDKRVEGLPVVNDYLKVVGVISRHDLRPLLRRSAYKDIFSTTLVQEKMSTPPVCVRPHARIGEVAGVMLAYKVHRLPVVDESGILLGIISRTDVYQPLLRKKESFMGDQRRLWINGSFPDTTFVDLDGFDSLESVDAFEESIDERMDAMGSMPFASGAAGEGMGGKTWDVKYLYDGGCSLCTMLVDMLQRRDPNERILFVDLRDPDYDARLNQNVSFEQGMETIHVIRRTGEVIRGPDALQTLYEMANLGWIVGFMASPVGAFLAGLVYKVVAALRLPLSGESMDAILAARRMRSAENDDLDWQCDNDDEDEGCEVPDDW